MEARLHLHGQLQPQQPVNTLHPSVQQQLNLEAVKTRAISLFKAISRILEDFNAYARTNTTPKWQDILGQYSMVNLELFNIVEEIKKVSKAFVVQPKNVNAQNSAILPVMLSSKLLPEMEMDDNSKREQLIQGMQNLPVATQIEKLKARIDMIAVACETAEKVLADIRKAYGFGTRQGPAVVTTLDKGQFAKIHEQETLLRAAVNSGESKPSIFSSNFFQVLEYNFKLLLFNRLGFSSSAMLSNEELAQNNKNNVHISELSQPWRI